MGETLASASGSVIVVVTVYSTVVVETTGGGLDELASEAAAAAAAASDELEVSYTIVVMVTVVGRYTVVPTVESSVVSLHDVALALIARSKYSSKIYMEPKARSA